MFGGRGKAKACNFVHNDEIWKDHVNMELMAQRCWTDKWGFLADEYKQLEENLLRIGEQEPSEKVEDTTQWQPIRERPRDQLQKPFPKTTTEMIGWKVQSDQGPQVQRHARGKRDIVKEFKWPREGI